MTDQHKKSVSLLPIGLRDKLYPEADKAFYIISSLLKSFKEKGYEHVSPPLIEFEASLEPDNKLLSQQKSFKVIDPLSEVMMAIRSDITLQIARIAKYRLQNAKRPLRLCYFGDILRRKGSTLRPQRQLTQIGAEIFGSNSLKADLEIFILSLDSLKKLGIEDLIIEFNMPSFFKALYQYYEFDKYTDLYTALKEKDIAFLEKQNSEAGSIIAKLIQSAAPIDQSIDTLNALKLPDHIDRPKQKALDELQKLSRLLSSYNSNLTLILDPLEHRGFNYHTDISFSFFHKKQDSPIARGGRYKNDEYGTGFTLYLDSITNLVKKNGDSNRIYIPSNISFETVKELNTQGWVTLHSIDEETDTIDHALEQNCEYILKDNNPVKIKA